MNHKTKIVKTDLDFHPNLEGDHVCVNLGQWTNSNEFYVSIWGGDDTSLQTDSLTFEQADELFKSIQKVTIKEANLFKGSINNNGFPSIRF